jgi:hypothetical protein
VGPRTVRRRFSTVYISTLALTESNIEACRQTDSRSSQPAWKSYFRQSRWFTCGLTFEELIAPPSLEFLSHEGESLSSKKSLERLINEITGVPIEALQGSPLSDFSASERMTCASGWRRESPGDPWCHEIGLRGIQTQANAHTYRRKLPMPEEETFT